MIARADIFIENFIPGKLAAIGLGWDDCRRINPRLIYASITGNNAIITSATIPSLTSMSKGMVRRGHTGRLQDTMSLSKAKVRLYVRLEYTRSCLFGRASGTDAHVIAQPHGIFTA